MTSDQKVFFDLPVDRLHVLLADFAKRWLAHDGLWFLAAEKKYGMEAAIELDTMAWEGFAANEARRILQFLGREPGGGLELLAEALQWRMYALINRYEVVWVAPDRLRFYMRECRVQTARRSKNLPAFPCRPVGETEYRVFCQTVDPRIECRCLGCPPDEDHDFDSFACGWEFTLRD